MSQSLDAIVALINRHNIEMPPEPTIVTFNPAYNKWVGRTATALCTSQNDDHGPMPCSSCLSEARVVADLMRSALISTTKTTVAP